MKEETFLLDKIMIAANENGIDSVQSLIEHLPHLVRDSEVLEKVENCLVCAAIADPNEVIENSLKIISDSRIGIPEVNKPKRSQHGVRKTWMIKTNPKANFKTVEELNKNE